MLGCMFSFEACTKNVQEKATKLLRFYWMLMDMFLPKFDIFQDTVAPNCFKSYTNSWWPDFFLKKVLSDVRSEIHLVRRNIVSTGHRQNWQKRVETMRTVCKFRSSRLAFLNFWKVFRKTSVVGFCFHETAKWRPAILLKKYSATVFLLGICS